VEEAIELLQELADRVEAPRAGAVLGPVERVYGRLREKADQGSRRGFVSVWKRPYMGVGSDTYAHNVLNTCGGENDCGGSTHYPVVALEEVEAMQSEVVLLPDEPYTFSAEDPSCQYHRSARVWAWRVIGLPSRPE